jgi:AraC-like DNA-binding protein
MNSRLDRIKDWPALAKVARYSVTAIARHCDVSPRQLERYFHIRMEKSPHHWLHELRMKRAIELICDGTPFKQIAQELCYKDTAYFAHDFKVYAGVTPGQYFRRFV